MIVPSDPADLDAIVALVNGAYRGEGALRSWTTEAGLMGGQRIDRAMLGADLAASSSAEILVQREGSDLLGCVWVELLPDHVAYLGMLSVRPELQAAGVGRRLLEAGEDWARSRGARRMRMSVVQVRDSLIAWYQRRGYQLTGETQPFPYEDQRFGVPLRDDLHFVILDKAL